MAAQPTKKQIGESLKTLRKSKGFRSAKAFAEFVGMSPTAYVEYEQGRSALPYDKAWTLADALGVTMDELGGRVPPMSATLASDEARVLSDYRRCDEGRRRTVATVAADLAGGVRADVVQGDTGRAAEALRPAS